MKVVKKGIFAIIIVLVMASVKSSQNVVMNADDTLSGIFTKFDEELIVSRNLAHLVIDFDQSTNNLQFYQIKIAVEKFKFEPDVQGFESNLERELSIVPGLFENLKNIFGGNPTVFHKEIFDALVTQYDQLHQNQNDLLEAEEEGERLRKSTQNDGANSRGSRH